MATDREPDQAACLVACAIGMAGSDVVRPVTARAATVYRTLRPWSGTRAVLELGGQLADLKIAEAED
jgi:hypothetical protein